MRIYEKDYRYLLLNLLPQHRLSPERRRAIADALFSGGLADLRRESILALEELHASGYLARTDADGDEREVTVSYSRRGGSYSFTLAVPTAEWTGIVSPLGTQAETAAVVRPPSPTEGNELIDFLPDIVRSFSVAERTDPILDRLEHLLTTIQKWLGFDGVTLYLVEDVLNLGDIAAHSIRTATEDELREDDVYRTCIETGLQRLVPRSKVHGLLAADAPADWDYVGVAPVFGLGKVAGILKLFFAEGIDEVTKKRRLEAASGLIKQAIVFNTQIETITSIDPLTQVYNRHFYDTQLSVEIERATRSGNEVSMLVIDIDDFKKINDEMGHKKGDEALGAVADLIRRNLRKVDLPFRYGGEEFVILLPGTSEFESVHTAERLRRVVSEHTGFKDLHGRVRSMTVSIGVAVFPATAGSADDLFTQADSAMYHAKQTGKNRVVLYRDEWKQGSG